MLRSNETNISRAKRIVDSNNKNISWKEREIDSTLVFYAFIQTNVSSNHNEHFCIIYIITFLYRVRDSQHPIVHSLSKFN